MRGLAVGDAAHVFDRFFDLVAEVDGVVVGLDAKAGRHPHIHAPAGGRAIHAALAGLDVAVGDAELHVVDVGMVDADRRVEVVGILVAGRVVADALALGVFGLELGAALADAQIAAARLGEVKNIRIVLLVVVGGGDHELPVDLIDHKLGVFAQFPGRAKSCNRRLIGFARLQLLGEGLFGAVAALVKPGRELGRAVLAHIAVLELPIAQKPDLVSTKIAVFLVKESHSRSFPGWFGISKLQLIYTNRVTYFGL